ncbi:UNVERIFIED_CONTAM: Retrovirus-related Pol polyprotein from transposon RE1 [Sesamum radiatum]|uniref:Retrovirus-related Pol polyprotein from transposon RE1 n=1 Tax=Sesamum radiatum TaxID=300843 RepID=A0AAW2NNU2_SESRA
MDVKTAFLNGFVEEDIFMDQPEVSLLLEKNRKSVISKGPSTASSKLPEAGTHVLMKSYGRISGSSIAYLVLYVDDILLIGNDVKMLGDIKAWLSTQFSMKDMGEASYILGIKIYRDRSRRLLGLTQSSYIEKVLKRFQDGTLKTRLLPMRHGLSYPRSSLLRLMRSLRGCRTSPMPQP